MSWALKLYSVATWAAQPLLRRKLARRARKEAGYAEAVPERFGRYEPVALGEDGRGQWIWVHAVSLGETRAAAILLKALREQLPGMRLLLTHGTATGRAEGRKLLRAGDLQVWQPWDTRDAAQRFVRQFRPAVGILMETEIWPNLVAACASAGVPLALANARLSERSLQGALRLAALSRPAYQGLASVWAQTEADAARLRQLGCRVGGVFGNLKFDVEPDAAQLSQGKVWRAQSPRPVVMFASSREGEEAMWLANLQPKRLAEPVGRAEEAMNGEATPVAGVQWLIGPRHPQRFDEVARLLESAGLSVARRSQWLDGPPPRADVWLGDSLGEMALYYGMADAALLGGSFAPLGGQNLIEAAACGCPVIMGPHTFNFSEASDLACAAGAALRVGGMEQGLSAACELACDAGRLTQARARAVGFATQHKGAAQATARAVAEMLGRGSGTC